jgi:broad specificity phosphatase PhoE
MATAFAIVSTAVVCRIRQHERRRQRWLGVLELPPALQEGLCNNADELQVDGTMKLIWHVRHGESTGNVARIVAQEADKGTGLDIHFERYTQSGDYDDTPLTERGKQQARETASRVATWGKKPTLIVSSPLTRSIETAAIVFESELSSGEAKLVIRPELREFYPDNRENSGRPRHELRVCPILQDLACSEAVKQALQEDTSADWGPKWDTQTARGPGSWEAHCGSLQRLDKFRTWLSAQSETQIACVSHFGVINNTLNGEPWVQGAESSDHIHIHGKLGRWGYRGLSRAVS